MNTSGHIARPPFVSVCVPTYNGEKFLRECLASLCAQTLTDFEVIVVDDDSTDGSLAIAEEFARNDARFRVQRNERRLGQVANWNRCLELSRGSWIKILFQDDTLEPDCLKLLTQRCEEQKCAFGFCARNFLFADQVAAEVRDYFARHQAQVANNFSGPMSAEEFIRRFAQTPEINPMGEPTVVIFHRSILEQFGHFNPLLIQLCDAEYWLRVGGNVGVVYVPERLASFRVHAASATTDNFSRRKYRATYLDPLVIRHLILRDKKYQSIRRILFQQTGRFSAWWRIIQHAHLARSLAQAQPAAAPDAISKMDEWQELSRQLVGLRSLALAGMVVVPLQHFLSRSGLAQFLNRFRRSGNPRGQNLLQGTL